MSEAEVPAPHGVPRHDDLAGTPATDEFRTAMDVVVWGTQQVVLAARPYLAASAGSAVVVGSLGSEYYARYYGALGPAKAALDGLVRYLGAELGPDGVRVNGVSPCLVDDPGSAHDAPEVRGLDAA